jgi:hypothetical protein
MTIVAGECMDVNNDGFAVGWYEDGSDDEQPFFFSPVDGGSAIKLTMDEYWFRGKAIAISETTGHDLDGAIIAGWAERSTGGAGDVEAVYWVYDNDAWDFEVVPLSAGVSVGESQAVSNAGLITGFVMLSGEERAFVYEDGDTYATTSGATRAVGMAIRDDATDGQAVSGYKIVSGPLDHAWYVIGSTQTDLHTVVGATYEESRVLAMNNTDSGSEDLVGYVDDHEGSPGASLFAAYWWYDSGWDVGILNTPSPDPVDYTVTGVNDRDANGYVDIVGHYAAPNLSRGVFYVTVDSGTSTYYSYQLDERTGGNAHESLVLYPGAVRDTAKTWTGNGINNTSWIAGSYVQDYDMHGSNDYRPCLYIPNDHNNNGVPDIREILQGDEDDTNENGLIDWAEDMRSGLFAPGSDGVAAKTILIENVQVVRLMDYNQHRIHCLVGGDEIDCEVGWVCDDHAEWFSEWGADVGDDGGVEIILNFRTVDPEGAQLHPAYPYDYLAPDTLDPEDEQIGLPEIERDLATFCYRYARCIDGFQPGNEIYTGPGRYWFYAGDLPETNYVGVFSSIGTLEAVQEATDAIFVQLIRQVEAARRGSALAGRPLRMFGPSISGGTVRVGFCGDIEAEEPTLADLTALAIKNCVDYANDEKLIFDQHVYYESYDEFVDTLDMITNNCSGCWPACSGTSEAPWGDGPDQIACLEYGPMPDRELDAWWDDNIEEATDFFEPGTIDCAPTNDYRWTNFVNAWWSNVNEWDSDFHLDDVLSDFSSYGFRYAAINAIQLGLQGTGDAKPTDVAALRADRVWDPDCIEDPNQFMPIANDLGTNEDYESEAAMYMISNFNPHPDGCECETACPDDDCGQ